MLIFPLFISGTLFVVLTVVICSVNMKRMALAYLVLMAIVSCNKAAQPLSRAEIRQKADSISEVRMRQLDDQAKADLEYRMKIEVKVKVDSIIVARMKSPVKDTIKKSLVKKDVVNRDNVARRDTAANAGNNPRRSVEGNQNNIQVGIRK